MASIGKLHYSPTSPYVRKVAIMGHEGGIWNRLELINAAVAPTMKETSTDSANPLAKVPALELPNGMSLFDSPVICEYLDQFTSRKFFPPAGDARWEALKLQALADGIMDAAILVRYETFLRPEEKRWPEWIEGQMRKITNSLDELEKGADKLKGASDMTIGEITIICAISYLHFRFPDVKIPAKVAAWHAKTLENPTVKATEPPK